MQDLIRRELEHIHQWKVFEGEPFRLLDLATELYRRRNGDPVPNEFRNQVPIEHDANPVASAFLRSSRPGAVQALREDDLFAPLVRATKPEPIETLLTRTVCFLLQYRTTLEAMAHDACLTVEAFLHWREMPKGAGEWSRLE